MLIVQTGELLDPSMLTSFNKKFEFQFPRTDLRNNYNSKVKFREITIKN